MAHGHDGHVAPAEAGGELRDVRGHRATEHRRHRVVLRRDDRHGGARTFGTGGDHGGRAPAPAARSAFGMLVPFRRFVRVREPLVASPGVSSRPAPPPAPARPAAAARAASALVLADSWPSPRSPAALVAALVRAGVEVATTRASRASPDLVYAAWGGEADAADLLLGGSASSVGSEDAPRLVLVLDAPPTGDAASARGALSRAVEVQAASPALAERALALGVDPRRVRLVRPGVDLGVFRPVAGPAREDGALLRLVCPAPLHWTAGLEYVVVALRRLVDAGLDPRLEVRGEGPARDVVLFTASDLGVLDRVAVRPPGAPESRALALAAADVVLLGPVEDRPWPGLLEAMACGRPVVATDGPSARDAVPSAAEGTLVPSRDPAALAAAVADLAVAPARRGTMGSAARARAAEAFDLDRAAREVVPAGTAP